MSLTFETAEDALAWVGEHYSPEQVFPDVLIFEEEGEVTEWAEAHGMIHKDAVLDVAAEMGMLTDDDLSDPWLLGGRAEKIGYRLIDSREAEWQHDEQGHTGAIAYCNVGLCQEGEW